jgi:rod shape-determining protein MreC
VRRGKYILYFTLLLAVVVLLNLPTPLAFRVKGALRDNLAPFLNFVSGAARRVADAGSLVAGGLKAGDEGRARADEVADLRAQVMRLKALEKDNEELRSLVGFRRRQSHRLIPCEVLARGDASGWWQSVSLNRGARDGIRPDLAVITPEGLVGRTLAVSAHTSEALLITDPNCRVACKLADRNAYGIVRGMGVKPGGQGMIEMLCAANPCRMEFIPRDEQVTPGAAVVTSGLGGIYPEGLPVGRVIEARADASRLYQRAELAPAADLAALKYVFVMAGDAPPGEAGNGTAAVPETARENGGTR